MNTAAPKASAYLELAPHDHVVTAMRMTLTHSVEILRDCKVTAALGETEAIHHFRVALRRLRAALELMSGVIHGARLKLYRRELSWLMRAAAESRECDVTQQVLHARAPKLEPALADALAPVYKDLAVRRAQAHQGFVTGLNSRRFDLLLGRLSMPVLRKLPSEAAVCAMLPAMTRRMARATGRFANKITPQSPPAMFHRMRIRIKRLRYVLDLMRAFGGKKMRKTAVRLAEMQELLGAYNDAVTAGRWLRTYTEHGAPLAATLLATGAMLHALGKRERKIATRVVKCWKRFDQSGMIRGMLAEMARNAKVLAPAPEGAINAA
ncbi:MAG: CHAD domain-containing protein [Candidatus Binataceae bacterium]